jgi:predicted TIM-barrel fold metal-dependent hydrolase
VYYAPYSDAMVPTWGWPVETGTHLLRMICGGVFDRYPRLKIIVGHMGELIPYCYTRLNSGLTMAEWLTSAQAKKTGQRGMHRGMHNSVGFYLKNNVFITSSGVFDQPVFECAKAMLGLDNLLFSVDDPFQDNFAAMEFLNACELSPQDKERFAHGTADRLLRLDGQARQGDADRPSIADTWYAARAAITSKVGRALISALVK